MWAMPPPTTTLTTWCACSIGKDAPDRRKCQYFGRVSTQMRTEWSSSLFLNVSTALRHIVGPLFAGAWVVVATTSADAQTTVSPAPAPTRQTVVIGSPPRDVQIEYDPTTGAVRVGADEMRTRFPDPPTIETVPIGPRSAVAILRTTRDEIVLGGPFLVLGQDGSVVSESDGAAHGDIDDQVRLGISTRDRTGEGMPDVVIGSFYAGDTPCGLQPIPRTAHAVDPSSFALRSVALKIAPIASEAAHVPGATATTTSQRADTFLFEASRRSAGVRVEQEAASRRWTLSLQPASSGSQTEWVEFRARVDGPPLTSRITAEGATASDVLRAATPTSVTTLARRPGRRRELATDALSTSCFTLLMRRSRRSSGPVTIAVETPGFGTALTARLSSPEATASDARLAADLFALGALNFEEIAPLLVRPTAATHAPSETARRTLLEALLNRTLPDARRASLAPVLREHAYNRASLRLLMRVDAAAAAARAGEILAGNDPLVRAHGKWSAVRVLALAFMDEQAPAMAAELLMASAEALSEADVTSTAWVAFTKDAFDRAAEDPRLKWPLLAKVETFRAVLTPRSALRLAYAVRNVHPTQSMAFALIALQAGTFEQKSLALEVIALNRERDESSASSLPALADALVTTMRAEEWQLRASSLNALCGSNPAADPLCREAALAHTNDASPRVRAIAFESLVRLQTLPPDLLERLAREGWPMVRARAATAMITSTANRDKAAGFATDRSSYVQAALFQAAASAREDSLAAPAAETMLAATVESDATDAAGSLIAVTCQPAGLERLSARAIETANATERGAELTAHIIDVLAACRSATPPLLESISARATDDAIRAAVARARGESPRPPALAPGLSDPD